MLELHAYCMDPRVLILIKYGTLHLSQVTSSLTLTRCSNAQSANSSGCRYLAAGAEVETCCRCHRLLSKNPVPTETTNMLSSLGTSHHFSQKRGAPVQRSENNLESIGNTPVSDGIPIELISDGLKSTSGCGTWSPGALVHSIVNSFASQCAPNFRFSAVLG